MTEAEHVYRKAEGKENTRPKAQYKNARGREEHVYEEDWQRRNYLSRSQGLYATAIVQQINRKSLKQTDYQGMSKCKHLETRAEHAQIEREGQELKARGLPG